MRVVVTGGAGFIGSAVVRRLRAGGADVVALDRDPSRAPALEAAGARFVRDDLRDRRRLEGHLRDADAVVHAAGTYRVGITSPERPAMTEANVGTTGRVLDAALEAGTPRIVHLSTYGIYGDTAGRVVDESYRRDPHAGYLSWYDETKHRAHLDVEARIAAGAPAMIVLPGAAYGPGDPSGLGDQLRRAAAGRLPAVGSPTLGVSWTHVDDLADGVVRVLERGRVATAYNVGGEIGTLRDGIEAACAAAGRRPPRLTAPAPALRAIGRLGPGICRRLGFPANLREAVRCTHGVTYWATHERAAAELGYAPRPMADGFRETFGAG